MKWIKTALIMLALSFSFNAFALDEDAEMAFKDALIGGDVKSVQKFIKAEPGLENAKFFGWSPLQMAANANQIEVVKFLISKGAELDYIQPNAHHTAFMLAAFGGYTEMMNLLAKSGANVNEKLKGDVSLIRYFRDENIPEMVTLLTKLGVKDDGCEDQCF
ncbi:MAG: ankyrin repeat domain-containing protein [Methylophilaceae bacterium]